MTFSTKAIVLRRRAIRESDRCYIFLTKEKGKIEALVRGGQKITSKLAPPLEAPAILRITLANGWSIHHLIGVESDFSAQKILDHLDRLTALKFSLELLDAFTKPEALEPNLFVLGERTIKSLNEIEPEKIQDLKLTFAVQLLEATGFLPEVVQGNWPNTISDKDVNFISLSRNANLRYPPPFKSNTLCLLIENLIADCTGISWNLTE